MDIYLGCQIGTKNINFVGDNKMNITTELGLNWLGGYGEYGNAKAYGQSEDNTSHDPLGGVKNESYLVIAQHTTDEKENRWIL